ncbi:hypothetical protein D9M68_695240 [compost metagenome]
MIAIGTLVVPGTRAILRLVGIEGMLETIPGPEIRNAKASLNWEQAYSGYSSEPNTYWNLTVSPAGIKSNCSTQALLVIAPFISAERSASPPLLGVEDSIPLVAIASTPVVNVAVLVLAAPVVSTIPLSIPRLLVPVKVPAPPVRQVIVGFRVITPTPTSLSTS